MEDSLQGYNSSCPWIEHEINTVLRAKKRSILYCRSWTRSIEKRTKVVVREMYTLVQKEDKHFLYNGTCTTCLDNNASEAEVVTDRKKPRKVNYQIH